MIFLTIGTQEPFDRLIKAVDEIALVLNTEIFAQVSRSAYKSKHLKTFNFVSPVEFKTYFDRAELIVSHAGMGTIISALESEKPIVIMPRQVKYNEHRNDHQLATAAVFEKLNYVHVAQNEDDLKQRLQDIYPHNLKPLHKIGASASPQLLTAIQNFIAI